jgi:hypothetical protein
LFTASFALFACRCVIIELFTDGLAPFDLSQLLAYRAADDDKHYQQVIGKIKNRDIQVSGYCIGCSVMI